MRRIFITTSALLLCACATVITPERASNIQVHNQMSTLLANCKNIGPVSAEGNGSIAVAEAGIPQAKTNARTKVADMGGDTLVILNTDFYTGSMLPPQPAKAVIQGVAMKCY
jgi:hypothetical protein